MLNANFTYYLPFFIIIITVPKNKENKFIKKKSQIVFWARKL